MNTIREINKLMPKIKYANMSIFENIWSVTPHLDHRNEIIYVQEGSLKIWTQDNEIYLKKGDTTIIPAKTIHRDIFEENRNPKIYFICFELKNYEFNFNKNSKLTDINKNLIEKEIHSIRKEWESDKNLANISLLKILNIFENSKNPKNESTAKKSYTDFTEKIKNTIKSEYDKDISLESLSREFDKSTYHISHIFNRYTGLTLPEYITKTRMQKATQFLLETNLNISQIAYRTGYKDPHYFTNVFKSYYNMTPKEYRAKYKEIKL
ncbi:MAG: helix-turn-helix transcriptional regulator [Armatimonadetes bacterium]|nr:helix-turn-helix transcriptional regulator [Candidatus Hippobium faecium]